MFLEFIERKQWFKKCNEHPSKYLTILLIFIELSPPILDPCQRGIQNAVEHLSWSVLRK